MASAMMIDSCYPGEIILSLEQAEGQGFEGFEGFEGFQP